MLIGIIEDDKLLNRALEISLQKVGYRTKCVFGKTEALRIFDGTEDLFLIDIQLPDGNGIEAYHELLLKKKIPAIFITARDEEKDMLFAFEEGAEDYVVKPFSVNVLLKRIEVVLRRNAKEKKIKYRDLTVDVEQKIAFMNGEKVNLTVKEYQLLEYLMHNLGQTLTKECILEHIWGVDGDFVVDNTVSVTVNRLRKKIEPDIKHPIYIQNVFGFGYRIGE